MKGTTGENDNQIPKCGLLALLPKPKGTTLATNAKAKISTDGMTTKLQSAFMTLKPRQIPAKPISSHKTKADESDSDDEEFEQKLSSAKAIVDQEEDLMEEGPVKPPQFNAQKQQKNPQKTGDDKPKIFVDRPLLGMDYGSSDSDEEDEKKGSDSGEATQKNELLPVDFFGLSAPKRPKLDDEDVNGQQSSMYSAQNEPTVFIGEVAPGPARPTKALLAADYSQEGDEDIPGPSSGPIRSITNQEASRLIYEKELAPFGVSSVLAEDAVSGMIDVSVDAALGPNVRQNLIRNLNNKQMAQIALGPLPKLKKSEADKLAKRKHQITHLAQVAVSREEQLQEKWAESKQNKKMSRQKYGF